jgi:CMP/dCMP kinase
MSKAIIVAIDGYSSCGKSTLAKQLAKHLNYKYVDSGAMYRGIALYLLQNDIDINDHDINVEADIRTPRIANLVSPIATVAEVRERAVQLQQAMGSKGGIVMDGRDIGTTVFPHAELKIFMTADIPVRSQRRYLEMIDKGTPQTLTEVEANLIQRDNIDSTRLISPLRKADDALLLDNTTLSEQEQFEQALAWAKAKIEA